jgi:predicted acetyltransferase
MKTEEEILREVYVGSERLTIKQMVEKAIVLTLKSCEQEQKEKVDELKKQIENAQEDFGNLDWISKEQAVEIIDEIFNSNAEVRK